MSSRTATGIGVYCQIQDNYSTITVMIQASTSTTSSVLSSLLPGLHQLLIYNILLSSQIAVCLHWLVLWDGQSFIMSHGKLENKLPSTTSLQNTIHQQFNMLKGISIK